jgi:hypothetical protein
MGSMIWWDGGHEYVLSSGSLENSPDDGTSRARFLCATHPYWRKLLVLRGLGGHKHWGSEFAGVYWTGRLN